MFGWCVCVCVRAFFCVCVQVKALRRADHLPKESCRMSKIKFNGGRPRPKIGAVSSKEKISIHVHYNSVKMQGSCHPACA
jgi:hypothetical protein